MKKTKKIISTKKPAKKTVTAKKAAKKTVSKKTTKKPDAVVASGAVSSTNNVVVIHPTEEPVASVLESIPAAAAKTRKVKR